MQVTNDLFGKTDTEEGKKEKEKPAYTYMRQQDLAPQTNDLDRARPAHAYPTVPLPLPHSPLLPNAPRLKQNRASSRAQRPSLNPIPSLPSQASTPVASSKPLSGSSLRDSDSPRKGLRPKSSYHQSLLNLRDEVQKRSESSMCHSVALFTHTNCATCSPVRAQLFSRVPLIWHLPWMPKPLGRQSCLSTIGPLSLPPMPLVVGILVKHRGHPALTSSANNSPLHWPARRHRKFRRALASSRYPHRGVQAPLRKFYPLAPRRLVFHLVLSLMSPPPRRGK